MLALQCRIDFELPVGAPTHLLFFNVRFSMPFRLTLQGPLRPFLNQVTVQQGLILAEFGVQALFLTLARLDDGIHGFAEARVLQRSLDDLLVVELDVERVDQNLITRLQALPNCFELRLKTRVLRPLLREQSLVLASLGSRFLGGPELVLQLRFRHRELLCLELEALVLL